MEAQRFPDDFDGLMPSAPVYDYTGRNMIAAAWFARRRSMMATAVPCSTPRPRR
jgi:hypothetical protein